MSALTTAPGPCASSASCTILGQGGIQYWADKAYSQTARAGTVVVVQVINTILNTTRFSTVGNNVPSGYVPPPTNAAGTKIATVAYMHQGTSFTTTVAYPTPFLEFPDTYTIVGNYPLAGSCVIRANKTFDIKTNPQPPWSFNNAKWNLTSLFDPTDPLGWGFSFNDPSSSSRSAGTPFIDILDLLPDDIPEMPHSVAKRCKPGSAISPFVAKADPNWRVVAQTSVVYEGKEGSRTPAASVPHLSKGTAVGGSSPTTTKASGGSRTPGTNVPQGTAAVGGSSSTDAKASGGAGQSAETPSTSIIPVAGAPIVPEARTTIGPVASQSGTNTQGALKTSLGSIKTAWPVGAALLLFFHCCVGQFLT